MSAFSGHILMTVIAVWQRPAAALSQKLWSLLVTWTAGREKTGLENARALPLNGDSPFSFFAKERVACNWKD